jgi:hypothetical protein
MVRSISLRVSNHEATPSFETRARGALLRMRWNVYPNTLSSAAL